MIDIHCHILSGMDDGAGNLSDSAEMAALSLSSGVSAVIATPHCSISDVFSEQYGRRLDQKLTELKTELARRKISIQLYQGREIFLVPDKIGYLLRCTYSPGLNGSRYLLVEFDPYEYTSSALGCLEQLTAVGYIPIVAHPERYRFVIEDPSAIIRMKRLGCMIQLNRGSILGRFGNRIKSVSAEIIKKRQADFVASDAHSQYSRTPYLADIHEYICGTAGSDYAAFLLHKNPMSVLADRERPVPFI